MRYLIVVLLLAAGCSHYQTEQERYCESAKMWKIDTTQPLSSDDWNQIEYYEHWVCTGGLSEGR